MWWNRHRTELKSLSLWQKNNVDFFQCHQDLPGSKLLVCAQSNSATNLLATRLGTLLGTHHIARLVSKTVMKRKKKEPNTLLREMMTDSVEKIALQRYRIVVTTLSLSAHLSCLGLGYFNRLFIDEASQASEPEVLVTLNIVDPAGCKVVIAGDPFQLGPVVKSKEAEVMGMGVSMLERLMTCTIYNDKPRDLRLITKLVQNYRSHKKLIAIPSKLFYEGELEACSDKLDVSARGVLRLLPWAPTSSFPLMWHDVRSPHKKGSNNNPQATSLVNEKELEIVMRYVKRLMDGPTPALSVSPGSIGIVTPYKAQAAEIRRYLNMWTRRAQDILVGTTEKFQVGVEREKSIKLKIAAEEEP